MKNPSSLAPSEVRLKLGLWINVLTAGVDGYDIVGQQGGLPRFEPRFSRAQYFRRVDGLCEL